MNIDKARENRERLEREDCNVAPETGLNEPVAGETPRDRAIGSDRRGVGPEAVLGAVCEQAILDYKALVREGIIVEGKCVKEWPRDEQGYNKLFLHEYNSCNKVNDLIVFLKNGAYAHTVDMLGFTISFEATSEVLGLISTTDQVA